MTHIERAQLTCRNFHIRRMNGLWWCRAPYDPTMMEVAQTTTGTTPQEAYKNMLSLLASPGFVPPPSTPRSRRLHELWQEAEQRQQIGLHRPWSSLDCAVRNGGAWLS